MLGECSSSYSLASDATLLHGSKYATTGDSLFTCDYPKIVWGQHSIGKAAQIFSTL